MIFIKRILPSSLSYRNALPGQVSHRWFKKTQERSYTGVWAIVEIKTSAVEHSGTPRGVAKRSQTLLTNGVTCWVRPTRRWFFQAFNFDFSLGIRTVVILAWCPRHHTMMWGAEALETGRSTVHHVTANTSAGCGHTTWDTNETVRVSYHKMYITWSCEPGHKVLSPLLVWLPC